MAFKGVWNRTSGWLRAQKIARHSDYQPDVDNEGLIAVEEEEQEQQQKETNPQSQPDIQNASRHKIPLKTIGLRAKHEQTEDIHQEYTEIDAELQQIKYGLEQQSKMQQSLLERLEQLPMFLKAIPESLKNQQQATENLMKHLTTAAAQNRQFTKAVEKLPVQTSKQTDALTNINHQLAAAADTDVQIVEHFDRFNQTLARLNETSVSQTESIHQLSKTFATSDRYLKFMVTKYNKRLFWLFVTTVGVCIFAILGLAGIITYLRQ